MPGSLALDTVGGALGASQEHGAVHWAERLVDGVLVPLARGQGEEDVALVLALGIPPLTGCPGRRCHLRNSRRGTRPSGLGGGVTLAGPRAAGVRKPGTAAT